ncbi:hypothetical protein J437_LFUL001004 [Ladona fulva]|uniref:Uncharacterized protein n=1 Tax=Ladona fulva TaxID=123851 RepID=A0A8K0KJT5_LADFU|nr:hypothetical protein J437_LFUL001004 [Ladona fulva]
MVDANDELSSPSHSLLASNARKPHSIAEMKSARSVTSPSSISLDLREGPKKARITAKIRVDMHKDTNSTAITSGKAKISGKNKQNSLASNPVGALVASLSKCVVRTEEDAEVAMNVSLKLFKSFLDYRVNMNASSAEKLVKAFIALISALEEHLPNVSPQPERERREAEDKSTLKISSNSAKANEISTKGAEVTFTEMESKKLSSQNSSKNLPPPPPPDSEDEAPPPPPPPPPPPTHPPPESSTNPPLPSCAYPGSFSYPPPPFTATSPTASSPVYPQNVTAPPPPPPVSSVFPPGTGVFPPPPPPPNTYQTSGFTVPAVAAPATGFSRPPPPIIRHGFPGPGRPPFPMHPMNYPNQRPPLPPHPYQVKYFYS